MLRLLFRIFLYTLLLVAFITFGPSGLLLDIQHEVIDIPLLSLTGPLEANNILSSAQKLFVNEISGPESIAVWNGSIYTGCEDGVIYRVDGNNHLKPVIKLVNSECPDVWNSSSCGRPAGMKFDSKGTLYVVEVKHGFFTVEDISTNAPKVTQVFDIKQTKSLGKQTRFINDIAIDESGGESGGHVLYISDVSTKHDFSQMLSLMSDSATGRLIRYNTATKQVDTVIDALLLPNGVELTDDRSAVLVAETGKRRIWKHYIRGPKACQTVALISALPGEPDNIRRSATKRETYWVALPMARNESNFVDTLNRHPLLRKFITRFLYLVGSAIDFIGNTFGVYPLKELGFGIKSGRIFLAASVKNVYGMVIEFDVNGNILQSLHSPDGSVSGTSEARELRISDNETALYLGYFMNPYIGKLVLSDRV